MLVTIGTYRVKEFHLRELKQQRQPEVRFSSLLIFLDATRFVRLSVFTLIETICPKLGDL